MVGSLCVSSLFHGRTVNRSVNAIKSRTIFLDMNSTERREARYQRRKAKRVLREKELIDELGSFEDVFSYQNLYDAFSLCKKGVRWKASIQSYEANLCINTYEIYTKLHNGTWKSRGFTKFKLSERGKVRLIQSVHISERCIQRTLCDKYLVPLLQRSLITDNGASIKGKGTRFAMERLAMHLTEYQKEFGDNGYILLYDFTNYFGSIPHEKLFELIDPKITDGRIRALCHQLINAFDEGLGLGSQVSQICAVYFANKIDHTFKDEVGIRKYARYMDDGYIISDSIDQLREYEQTLYKLCEELGILINPKKIRICKLAHGFTFLKRRYRIKDGKIEVRLSRSSFRAVKRRLRKMKQKNLPPREIWKSYNSWRGTTKGYANSDKVRNIDKYYNDMFVKEDEDERTDHEHVSGSGKEDRGTRQEVQSSRIAQWKRRR